MAKTPLHTLPHTHALRALRVSLSFALQSDILLAGISEGTARRFYRKCGYLVEQVAADDDTDSAVDDEDTTVAVLAAASSFHQQMAIAALPAAAVV